MRCPNCGKKIGIITYLLYVKKIKCPHCHTLLRYKTRKSQNIGNIMIVIIGMYGTIIIGKVYKWIIIELKNLVLFCIKIIEKSPIFLNIIWILFIFYINYLINDDIVIVEEEKKSIKDDKNKDKKEKLLEDNLDGNES